MFSSTIDSSKLQKFMAKYRHNLVPVKKWGEKGKDIEGNIVKSAFNWV